jgi:hypothetical protein
MAFVPFIHASRRLTLFHEPPLGQVIGHLDTGSNHHGQRNVLMTLDTVTEGQTNAVISDLFMSLITAGNTWPAVQFLQCVHTRYRL